MNRGGGFKNTDLARSAGKLGKKNSYWNTNPACGTWKAQVCNMKYRQEQKGRKSAKQIYHEED